MQGWLQLLMAGWLTNGKLDPYIAPYLRLARQKEVSNFSSGSHLFLYFPANLVHARNGFVKLFSIQTICMSGDVIKR